MPPCMPRSGASTAKADDVLTGTLSLDRAYAEVKQDAEGRMRPIDNETGARVIRRIAV